MRPKPLPVIVLLGYVFLVANWIFVSNPLTTADNPVQNNWVYSSRGPLQTMFRTQMSFPFLSYPINMKRVVQPMLVHGDWVYYRAADGLRKVRTTGFLDQPVSPLPSMSVAVVDEQVFFVTNDGALHRTRATDNGLETLMKDCLKVVVQEGRLYVLFQDGFLKSYDLQFQDAEVVSANVSEFILIDGLVLYTLRDRKRNMLRLELLSGKVVEIPETIGAYGLTSNNGHVFYYIEGKGSITKLNPVTLETTLIR